MSYEKDKLDGFVTSGSLSTALAPYVTSNSLSAAIAGISLSQYVTSNSLSAAVATNTLTVRGAASVSATMSAAAVTVSGRPVGAVLLGTSTQTNTRLISYSGSWSDFPILELQIFVSAGGGNMPVDIYSDGGTTSILACNLNAAITLGRGFSGSTFIAGANGGTVKFTRTLIHDSADTFYIGMSRTANAAVLNYIKISMTQTASVAFTALYGWRQA